MNLVDLIKNKVLFYLVSRYATYFIQFVTSLIIAAKLGPYYMGIWGFILLLLNYFQQCHFGIANSFNVLYIHHRDDKQQCDSYTANSLVLLTYLCVVVFFIYIYYVIWGIPSFDKYHIDKYFIWVCIIAVFQYYQNFLLNFFRVRNELYFVAFCQSIVVLLNFICIFFFAGEQLIDMLVAGYVLGNALCIAIAFVSQSLLSPKVVSVRWSIQSEILKKGLFLFMYNSCFYFIIISIRTVISAYYSVEEFGLFTFSFTVAHAILLLLEAMSFVIFPKVISKLSSNNSDEVKATLALFRQVFITSAHLLIYFALIAFPVLVMLMPKYEGALTCLNLIALSILMNSNVTGYTELLIAKNKEKNLSFLSFSALIINCLVAMMLVEVFHVPFDFVILATMFAYLIYSFCVVWYGEMSIQDIKMVNIIKFYFPIRLLLPYCLAVAVTVLHLGGFFLFLPLLLFLMMNIKVYHSMKDTAIKIMHKPEIVNL